jgi:hypothetical protein
MPRAMRITDANVEKVMVDANKIGFNLQHLSDEIWYNTQDGFDTYLITDGSVEDNNVVFTTHTENDFCGTWKFNDAEMKDQFVEIRRI